RVDVSGETSRRLRSAERDHVTHVEAAQRIELAGGPVPADQPGRLRENVVRGVVGRDREIAVTLRVPGAQPVGRPIAVAVDGGALCGHADEGASLVQSRAFAGVDVEAER